MLRKFTIAAMCLCTACLPLFGCGTKGSGADDNKLKIVCTIFPEYDWVNNLLGDHAEDANVTYLMKGGTDLHNFQPSADDIISISDCDLFIYVGGESDSWAEDALETAINEDMQVIKLLDAIGDSAVAEELVPGMAAAEEDEDEDAFDEHVWLSLKNAEVICSCITDKLCAADKDNAEDYRNNLASYTEKLNALDMQFEEMLGSAASHTLIFGDRFPFRYFTNDYSLEYYAAFPGCASQSDIPFETVIALADRIDETHSDTIFILEGTDPSMAETIISNTEAKNASIAVLDSLQSVSDSDIESGKTYLSAMQNNYDILKEALN